MPTPGSKSSASSGEEKGVSLTKVDIEDFRMRVPPIVAERVKFAVAEWKQAAVGVLQAARLTGEAVEVNQSADEHFAGAKLKGPSGKLFEALLLVRPEMVCPWVCWSVAGPCKHCGGRWWLWRKQRVEVPKELLSTTPKMAYTAAGKLVTAEPLEMALVR